MFSKIWLQKQKRYQIYQECRTVNLNYNYLINIVYTIIAFVLIFIHKVKEEPICFYSSRKAVTISSKRTGK